jgi:ACT domain-containing protein
MLNTNDKIIKHKTGLLNLAEELGNVSKACQVMGYSRDTFYRYKQALEDGGVEDQRYLRTLSQNHFAGVLSGYIPKEAV